MSLRVDLNAIIDEIVTLLKTNLSDLNTDLIKPFTDIDKQIINNLFHVKPSYATKYPYLFIYPIAKDETFNGLGAKGRKEIDQLFGITGIARIMSLNAIDDNKDAYTMSANVDFIFRENIKFSDKILYSNPQRATYDLQPTQYNDGVYVSLFTCEIETKLDVIGV